MDAAGPALVGPPERARPGRTIRWPANWPTSGLSRPRRALFINSSRRPLLESDGAENLIKFPHQAPARPPPSPQLRVATQLHCWGAGRAFRGRVFAKTVGARERNWKIAAASRRPGRPSASLVFTSSRRRPPATCAISASWARASRVWPSGGRSPARRQWTSFFSAASLSSWSAPAHLN